MNVCPENRLLQIIKKSEETKETTYKKKNVFLPYLLINFFVLLLITVFYFVNLTSLKDINKNKVTKTLKTEETNIKTIPPPNIYTLVGLMEGDNPYVIVKKVDDTSLKTIAVGEYLDEFKLMTVLKKEAVFQKNNLKFIMRISQ